MVIPSTKRICIVDLDYPRTFERLSLATYGSEAQASNAPTAYFVDMLYAVHPNYTEKHDDGHHPHTHKGIVVKINAIQRYATTVPTTVGLSEVAKKYNDPLQEFVVSNEQPLRFYHWSHALCHARSVHSRYTLDSFVVVA
ncbi:MAG: aminopeptidase I zinc metalloprotease-domain-containing protein [Linnemannia elongata]|nr:MAG: aminopeptidase I zinc metalloprotease-domain-containing protein [Linnemannia elongata]